MMLLKSFFAVALFVLMAFTSVQQTVPDTTAPVAQQNPTDDDGVTFKHGEELVYKIYYNLNFIWVPAGEVSFRITDEGNQFHYNARGKTYSSYEWFYQVKDEYDSWVDKATYLPNYSERSVNEGGYHIFEKISFNQSGHKTTVWRSTKKGDPETKTEHGIKSEVHDVLSILYYLRNLEFNDKNPGYTVPFSVFMDQEEFPLKMRYMGKEPRKNVHNMGKYRTMKFQPAVIAGNVFTEDAKMTVWVSDDANKIPLLIESPVSVGSVKMTLKSYRGLKYDFLAKVD
jgi:hypothetical protein